MSGKLQGKKIAIVATDGDLNWSLKISGGEWMIFQPKQLLWVQCFGFVSRLPRVATSCLSLGIRVSGPDFSRAVQAQKRSGL